MHHIYILRVIILLFSLVAATGKTEKHGFYPRSKSRQTKTLLLCLVGTDFLLYLSAL